MRWKLHLYPGGQTPPDQSSRDHADEQDSEESPNPEEKKISLYFTKVGDGEVVADYTLIIRNASGKIYRQVHVGECHYKRGGNRGVRNWSCVKRADIVDAAKNVLVDGALLVDVELRVKPDPSECYVPQNPHEKNMLALLENQDSQRADIAFKVEDTKIFAHKIILEANAPVLFSLCGRYNKRSPVPIEGVVRPVFDILLRYVYAGSVPGEDEMKKWGKEIIDAANRYGVVGLKMAAESAVVQSMVIRGANVVTWLLFADAKTCPLIKEYGMAIFAVRPKDFLSDWRLKGSPALKQELVMASLDSFDSDTRFGGSAKAMSVSELRKRLDEEDLDVDGSKEMLVARLEESNKRQRTE